MWLCDPMACSTPDFPALHHLLGFAQAHNHWVNDGIQPPYPPSSPSPPALIFPSIRVFPVSQLFASGGLSIGASAGSQREELRPWQRSWGRGLGIRKGVIKPQETSCSRASTPKARVYLEIISIVGWLGIILVKGFSFVPIITANSLPWVWQGCLRSNLSADKLACVTGLSILHDCFMIVYYLSTVNSTESFGVFWES